jgi:UDP-N-acetyl-D-mannosaminuronic acid dehydrogenase
MNVANKKIADVCIVGLGYVGLTLASAFANAGLRVVGLERDPIVVSKINSGKAPFHEVGLDEVLLRAVNTDALRAFGNVDELPLAEAYVVTVGTPIRSGRLFLNDLDNALETISEVMPENALVVLRSTVRVGTTRGLAGKILEESGKHFTLAMAPERTIEGKALSELTSLPQIIGGIDKESLESATKLFSSLGVEIVQVSSVEAAELAKLASNTYRDVQFAFANELAYFSDSSGVDVYEVVRACNHGYARTNVSLPGPVAGPCLEKDAYILDESAKFFGSQVPLSLQGRKTNERILGHISDFFGNYVSESQTKIGILGLAFKGRPETSDTRGSLAASFASEFRKVFSDCTILGWDPVVGEEESGKMGIEFRELNDVVDSCGLILIQTNHLYFSSLEFVSILNEACGENAIVVDLWNQISDQENLRPDIQVFSFGRMSIGAS